MLRLAYKKKKKRKKFFCKSNRDFDFSSVSHFPHQEDVQTLLDHVNLIRPSIQFTMGQEDNKLSSLDVLITHTELAQSVGAVEYTNYTSA